MVAAAALLALGLAGCETTASTGGAASGGAAVGALGLTAPAAQPGAEDLALGKDHFRSGNYGLAQKHFQQAVERAPDSLEPLIGLAATYDQLGRFDLADRAYAEAVRIGGTTTVILNNRGYSYYLRRDFGRARADFQAALRRDPQNETAQRNLALLSRPAGR
jgi:Flp pilus assembly protein TadD